MDWQTIIATLIVIAAAGWLIRRMWRIVRGGSQGGQISSCGSCSKNLDATKSTTVVQLGNKRDS